MFLIEKTTYIHIDISSVCAYIQCVQMFYFFPHILEDGGGSRFIRTHCHAGSYHLNDIGQNVSHRLSILGLKQLFSSLAYYCQSYPQFHRDSEALNQLREQQVTSNTTNSWFPILYSKSMVFLVDYQSTPTPFWKEINFQPFHLLNKSELINNLATQNSSFALSQNKQAQKL